MFNLAPSQLAVLSGRQVDGYVGRAQAFVHEHFPDLAEAFGTEVIELHARMAAGRANLYGMPAEKHAMLLMVLMLLVGQGFDAELPESPQVQSLLAQEDLDPDSRLDAAFQLLGLRWGAASPGTVP